MTRKRVKGYSPEPNRPSMTRARYVIIGAGFAGASVAYHLSRRFGLSGVHTGDIVVVEQEAVPGVHSSGRNASMIRQVVPDPAIASLAMEGAAFLQHLPPAWPTPVSFDQNGSLLLASGKQLADLQRDAEAARERGVTVELWTPEEAQRRVEILRGAAFEGALWCPTDGVVDIHALLTSYLKAASSLGARIRYGAPVKSIDVSGGRVTGVVAGDERIETEAVINAAGAWAGAIANLAGAQPVPLRPMRRHLFLTPPLPWVSPSWPFIWDISNELYFRPDSGGLLLCACDQDEMPPGIPPADESVVERLAEKVKNHFPEISDVPIKTSWTGLRTFSPDGRFVIGWDARVKGFFWVAGLGGHGVTTSAAVGNLAARVIGGEASPLANTFSPGRFAAGGSA